MPCHVLRPLYETCFVNIGVAFRLRPYFVTGVDERHTRVTGVVWSCWRFEAHARLHVLVTYLLMHTHTHTHAHQHTLRKNTIALRTCNFIRMYLGDVYIHCTQEWIGYHQQLLCECGACVCVSLSVYGCLHVCVEAPPPNASVISV